jgi:MGT family glycosyltransferase
MKAHPRHVDDEEEGSASLGKHERSEASMSKYLFLDLPLYGHVNPTLAVVQELVKRGHHVSYYLPERFRSAIQATGANFCSYQSMINPRWVFDASGLPQMLPGSLVKESLHVLPQVLERIRAEQPDCLVYDHACIWGHIVVQILNVPAIAWYPFYVMNRPRWPMQGPILTSSQPDETKRQEAGLAEINLRSIVQVPSRQSHLDVPDGISDQKTDWEKLCEAYQVPPTGLHGEVAAQLYIVFLPKEWQPNGHLFDEHYLFVGPSILARHEESNFPFDQLSDKVPILYISLGTLFNNWPNFFKMCFEAFGEQSWQVVLSKSEQVDLTALGPVPDNFLVAPHVPQLEILSRTHVFVTHAGMNSTMESLYYGVPMVAIPQNFEQAMTAHRIAHMGLGMMLEKEAMNATTLCEAVERVANNTSFRQRAQIMQRIIRREPSGYQRATDAIIQFAQEQVKGHESPSNARLR